MKMENIQNVIIASPGTSTDNPVIEIDNLGRVNLSRRAVLEKSTGDSGSKDEGSDSVDYPFKSNQSSRPQQRSQDFRNKRR